MKKWLMLVIVLFISISAVSASENLTDSVSVDSDNVELEDDGIVVQQDVLGKEDLNESDVLENSSNEVISVANTSNESKTSIQADNYVWYVKANPTYKFRIVDSDGKGVSVKKVAVKVNKKTRYVNTDANGYGKLSLKGLIAGKYSIIVKYGGTSVTKRINLFSSRVTTSKDITSVYGKRVKYSIYVVDNARNPAKGKKVKFITNAGVYSRHIDKKGFASVKFRYYSGKYFIKYKVDGLSGKNKYVVKNFVSLETLRWGLRGDVADAPLIRQNIPNNVWVKKAVKATRDGLPLITIKGGNGKVVFMTAGVHGNELNSQVAAMKMIKYLTEHPIRGTVYFVPFVNVKAISERVRLTDYDFNRVAHESGTVSNNIINLILQKKCDAYGDFHTTVSPGVPGLNVVLGYTSPGSCVPMSHYIADNANVDRIFYYPGEMYRWSLADYCNSKGTPAVICEAISPVNEVSARATSISFAQMTYFLKFNKIFAL